PASHECGDCGWSLAGAGTRSGSSLVRAALGLVWTGREHRALPSSGCGTTIREHPRRERMRVAGYVGSRSTARCRLRRLTRILCRVIGTQIQRRILRRLEAVVAALTTVPGPAILCSR